MAVTNAEIKALRKLLFLSVAEASELVAGFATPRSWRRLEAGTRPVSAELAAKMWALAEERAVLIESCPTRSPEDETHLQKRIRQSAAAHLMSKEK